MASHDPPNAAPETDPNSAQSQRSVLSNQRTITPDTVNSFPTIYDFTHRDKAVPQAVGFMVVCGGQMLQQGTIGPMSTTTVQVDRSLKQVPLSGSPVLRIHGDDMSPLNTICIGRTSNCDIILADGSISKLQARIRISRDGVGIQDCGSKNGSRVDGDEVPGVGSSFSPLSSGCLIELGNVPLRFYDPEGFGVLVKSMEPWRRDHLRGLWVALVQEYPFAPENARALRGMGMKVTSIPRTTSLPLLNAQRHDLVIVCEDFAHKGVAQAEKLRSQLECPVWIARALEHLTGRDETTWASLSEDLDRHFRPTNTHGED